MPVHPGRPCLPKNGNIVTDGHDASCRCETCAAALVEFIEWLNTPRPQTVTPCADCGTEATSHIIEPPVVIWLCGDCRDARRAGEPRPQSQQGQGRLL